MAELKMRSVLSWDGKQFVSGVEGAIRKTRQLEASAGGVRGALRDAFGKTALGGLIAGGVAGLAVAAIQSVQRLTGAVVNYVASSVRSAAALRDEAGQLGLTIEGYQRLRYELTQNGLSISQLVPAVMALTRARNEALRGTQEYAKAIAQVGIEMRDLAQMTTEDMLERVADAATNAEGGLTRMAAAYKLLGETGMKLQDVLPAIAQGIDKLGDGELKIIEEREVRKLAAANDIATQIGTNMRNSLAKAVAWFAGASSTLEAAADKVRLSPRALASHQQYLALISASEKAIDDMNAALHRAADAEERATEKTIARLRADSDLAALHVRNAEEAESREYARLQRLREQGGAQQEIAMQTERHARAQEEVYKHHEAATNAQRAYKDAVDAAARAMQDALDRQDDARRRAESAKMEDPIERATYEARRLGAELADVERQQRELQAGRTTLEGDDVRLYLDLDTRRYGLIADIAEVESSIKGLRDAQAETARRLADADEQRLRALDEARRATDLGQIDDPLLNARERLRLIAADIERMQQAGPVPVEVKTDLERLYAERDDVLRTIEAEERRIADARRQTMLADIADEAERYREELRELRDQLDALSEPVNRGASDAIVQAEELRRRIGEVQRALDDLHPVAGVPLGIGALVGDAGDQVSALRKAADKARAAAREQERADVDAALRRVGATFPPADPLPVPVVAEAKQARPPAPVVPEAPAAGVSAEATAAGPSTAAGFPETANRAREQVEWLRKAADIAQRTLATLQSIESKTAPPGVFGT